jgi:hypothetical protein
LAEQKKIHLNPILKFTNSKIAIYATYPKEHDSLTADEMVATLKKNGYFAILVSNSQNLLSPSKIADFHLQRENIGRDLAAYRDALALIDSKVTKELLLLNDSCWWTEKGIVKAINSATKSNSQITSVTESAQRAAHLQTYFLHVKNDAIETFASIFKATIRNWRIKRSIVTFGELRLQKLFHAKNLSAEGLFSEATAVKYFGENPSITLDEREALHLIKLGIHINPSQYFWRILWEEYGFVKKSLIISNPCRLKFPPELAQFKFLINNPN